MPATPPGGTGGGGHGGKSRGGAVTPQSWAESLLIAIGAPRSKANIDSVVSWEAAEGGNWNNTATYNPLNTTLVETGSTSVNPVGVQAYTSWSEGMSATVATLQNGNYQDILTALRSGKGLFSGTFEGLADWSGGGYDSISPHAGYGGGVGATIGQQGQPTADPSTCLLAWPSAHIDLFFGMGPTVGGGCIFAKSQARALLGAVFLAVGGLAVLSGANGLLLIAAVPVAEKIATVILPAGRIGKAARSISATASAGA